MDSERSGATWFPADRVGHAWEDIEPSGWERRIDWSRRGELVYELSEDTAAEVNEQERER